MSNAYRSTLAGGGSAPVGDATAADVLTGKTFSGAVGSGVTGTMPNQGAVSGTATPSQPYTIPAGYHNGSGVVTASSIYDKTKTEYFSQSAGGGTDLTINTTHNNPIGIIAVSGTATCIYWFDGYDGTNGKKLASGGSTPEDITVTVTQNTITIANPDTQSRNFTGSVFFA